MGTPSRQSPEFWNRQHAKGGARWTEALVARAAEIFNGLPSKVVEEYGFGCRPMAPHLNGEWHGYDFSPVAVEKIADRATVRRCNEAEAPKGYICGIALLPNLTEAERETFLDRVRGAEHAIFTVKPGAYRSQELFAAYLRRWWAVVDVEAVGQGWLAHCHGGQGGPKLTVGSSTLLDFGGAHWTIASWLTHHGTFGGDVEYVIVDNHPEETVRCKGVRGFFCDECKRIGKDGPVCPKCRDNLATMKMMVEGEGARYVRWSEKQGTYPGKNQLKVEARGKFVLTMDSHVLLTPHAIETCLEEIDRVPETDDFYHFPNLIRSYEPSHPGRPAAMDFRKQDWIYHGDGDKRGSVYGWTNHANTPGDPYPIAAMITSCYMVRREAWFSAKGYDPILGNYGGWEGPIQLKWWLMGRRVLQLRYKRQEQIDAYGMMHHYHEFWNKNTRKVSDNQTMHVHSGRAKMRNFAASSAVIGGEWWVRRHCELKGWDFHSEPIQTGFAEGMKLRPWMVANLARPEWEDIREFFKWMRDEEKVPGALKEW